MAVIVSTNGSVGAGSARGEQGGELVGRTQAPAQADDDGPRGHGLDGEQPRPSMGDTRTMSRGSTHTSPGGSALVTPPSSRHGVAPDAGSPADAPP